MTTFILSLIFLLVPLSMAHGETINAFIAKQLQLGRKANGLIDEKSPYLLQHAFNPVNWQPWQDKALARARQEDKPIFLSIGYSTCHWCHVMAHESFADPIIADFLNQHFICIKVDREERPDIDQIYMSATQAMSGSGGWPMSVFLLPDGKPFYAGTYFPPASSHGRPGFLELLTAINTFWHEDREKLSQSAASLTTKVEHMARSQGIVALNNDIAPLAYQQQASIYDDTYGGFGSRPKFPRPVVFDFLFRYYHGRNMPQAKDMALFTLKKMAQGGMYDQLGGGFHRYSVDGQWRVPHFEKMLYDQGQLALAYFDAATISDDPFYKQIGIEIVEYVLKDMQAAEGGFFSAEDADSRAGAGSDVHGEGLFYIWSSKDIGEILTPDEAALFSYVYGVTSQGNALEDPQHEFIGQNILYQAKSISEAVHHFKISVEEIDSSLHKSKKRMLAVRATRPRPHLDDKIITAWNGLMISGLARAYAVTGEQRYVTAANRAVTFINGHMLTSDNTLLRRYRDGEAAFAGQLDDYAFYVQALLDLYGVSFNVDLLHLAEKITRKQVALFSDEDNGGFFDSPGGDTTLFVRMKDVYDGAEPAGNSVAAMNLLRLAEFTGNRLWRQRAEQLFPAFPTLAQSPSGMPLMVAAYEYSQTKPRQIIIVGEAEASDSKALLQVVHQKYLPNTVLVLADEAGKKYLQKSQPVIAAMEKIDNLATAYVCENFSCKQPVNSPEALAGLLTQL